MMHRVKAVILAAGKGDRMYPLTETRPKAMLTVANKPILEHLIIECVKAGIKDFVIVTGHRGQLISRYFGDGSRWGAEIKYANQTKQLGTAHAVKAVARFAPERFLLMNADILIKSADIAAMLRHDGFAMGIFESENCGELGAVTLSHTDIVRIAEKSRKSTGRNPVNAGVYLLTDDIFDAVSRTKKSPRGEYELTTSLQMLIDRGCRIKGVNLSYWQNASYPWDILDMNESVLSSIQPFNQGQVEENVAMKGAVQIGEGTLICANSYLVGPVCIGENCRIGPNCFIRPATSISNNCHIGSYVEIKNSIIMADTNIPHHNYVGDSVIGEGCNLGAGTKIANLRFDKKQIKAGEINSGRNKLGAIIGDGVQTGINASIDSGSLIGNETWIGPGALVGGIISAQSRIYRD